MEEKRKFEAEVQKILHLVIHSLYSDKDIFLRELVANASDAIDKARFESLKNPELTLDWEIKIEPDKTRNKLKISDNGIGMTRDELIRDIGTIASSGTKVYLDSLTKSEEMNLPELIGQFGVGFYSAFMVAEKIEVVSKKAGSNEPAVRWESTGESDYTIDEATKSDSGTEITLELKPDCKTYLEEWKIRDIIKKYSDFIEYPIRMQVKNKDKNSSQSIDYEILNSMKAIWLKKSSDVKDEEYNKFYGHLSHSDSEPLSKIHFSAEGTTEFKALLFIPSKAPFGFFGTDHDKKGIHLYVRRVFITDELELLLPGYLRFIKGVVESNDLPLNISREMLQNDPKIEKIKKNIIRKVLAELKKMLENEKDKYEKFFREFGNILKEGISVDFSNHDAIMELLMFETLNNEPGKLLSLKEYCLAMPVNQSEIYIIYGENRVSADNSPLLEQYRAKNFDVIVMTEAIDEWIIPSMREFSGKKIKVIGKDKTELENEIDENKAKNAKEANAKFADLLREITKKLSKYVKETKFSTRMTESPCCLVADEFAPGPHMEKIMKAMRQEVPEHKFILELNPEHSLCKNFIEIHKKNPVSAEIGEIAELLYNYALISEGKPAKDLNFFRKKIAEIMTYFVEKKAGNS